MKPHAFAFAALLLGSASSLGQVTPTGGLDKKANSQSKRDSAEDKKSPQDLSREADRLLAKGDWKGAYAVIEKAHAAMDGVDLAKIPAWYQQLVFKRGWCALKLEKWKEAGESFERNYRNYRD